MAYIPLAQEISVPYTLTAPDGTVAVLNNSAHAEYVGEVTAVTGLDSADVRESAEELVEADGGSHGAFYFGRRPFTLTVLVYGLSTMAARATRVDKLRRATTAMGADGAVTWAPSTDPTMTVQVPFRRQQPFRDTGGWNKELLLALVSETAVIQSAIVDNTAVIASGTPVVIENKGNYAAFPVVRFTGIASNPSITDGYGRQFFTTGLGASGLASGETVEFDLLRHNGVFVAGARAGQSANRYIDFATTVQWPSLAKGSNTFTLSGGGTMQLFWRHTWC